ncbi:MAG: extracellular solute-binding protein [Clostridia bacterium]|nr:extracellular solute-binding protein [Clostridia bacterium]
MKKTLTLILIAAILTLSLVPVLTACNNGGGIGGLRGMDTLVIYNWEDYIDPSILDDFCAYYEEVTGDALSITYTTFDTNETMMTKVLKNDCDVDLICPSDYSIQRLMQADTLLSQKAVYEELKPQLDELGLDFKALSSIREDNGYIEEKVVERITGAFSSIECINGETYNMKEFMVPYFYGTLGILYNVNYVTVEELEEYGWGVLWNVQENEELENMILMKDSVRDTYAACLFYMHDYNLFPEGYEQFNIESGHEYTTDYIDSLINCTDDAVLNRAEEILTEQREHISGYEVDFGKDDMLNETVYADFAWSGDALWAIEESYDEETEEYMLDYFVPSTCSNIWFDGWVIPKTVKNKLAAMMFLDYISQPLGGIRNSMEVGYTSSVSKDIINFDDETSDPELAENAQEARDYIEECEYLLESEYEWEEVCSDEDYQAGTNIPDGFASWDEYFDSLEEEVYFNEDEETWGYDGELVEEGYFDDLRRYPVIDNTLGMMQDFGSQNDALVQMWQTAKSGSHVDYSLYIVIGVIIGVVGLGILAYVISQKAKLIPKKRK